tara:strand:+ start:516 stop:791 length:276 start_codon:yes stop_codon:yes gene_type:complete
MNQLIKDNYDSIVKRGFISPQTTVDDFLNKIDEEVLEFKYEILNGSDTRIREELADVILVCLNIAKHYNIDIEKEMKNKIGINYQRAINGA